MRYDRHLNNNKEYYNSSPYQSIPENNNNNHHYYNKPTSIIPNDSIKKDYSFFKNSEIKTKSPVLNQRRDIGFKPSINDSSYNWLFNEKNDIDQGVKVIKAEDYLNKIPDNTISNNKQKNVSLNTTAIQHMLKNPHQVDMKYSCNSYENVMKKLNFDE